MLRIFTLISSPPPTALFGFIAKWEKDSGRDRMANESDCLSLATSVTSEYFHFSPKDWVEFHNEKQTKKAKPSKFYTSIQLFFWSSGNENVIWPLKCVPRRFMFQAIWKKKNSYFTDLKEKILWLCFGRYITDWKGHFLSHVSSDTLGEQWEGGER